MKKNKQDTVDRLKKRLFLPNFLKQMKKMGIGGLSGGNRVTLISNGDDFFKSIIQSIDGAKSSINLESYIFKSDDLGMLISEKLAAKAESGVEVNVIYDSVGTFGASSTMFKMMKQSGVEILEYHPFLPWRKYWNLSMRDHRKILVIDGERAFVGGINIGLEYAGEEFQGCDWRDSHVMVEGPAVRDVQFFFLENWYRNGGSVMNNAVYFPNLREMGDKMLMVLNSKIRRNVRPVHASYVTAISNARKKIFITNAYFIPDAKIYRALVRAVKKGVEVCVLLPGKSDVPIVKIASRYLYKRYLRNGIRIFEYGKNILHAKTAVIDSIWSTVGSSNLDHRSFMKNLEVNVVVLDESFGKEMESAFADDLKKSSEVTLENFGRRGPLEFFFEWLCYRFRNFF